MCPALFGLCLNPSTHWAPSHLQVMRAGCVGEVMASKNAKWPVGSLVLSMTGMCGSSIISLGRAQPLC